MPAEEAKGEAPPAPGEPPQHPATDASDETPVAFDTKPDGQGTAPKQQADAQQTQHTTVSTGPGEASDVPGALGQGPKKYDEERHIAALMDVADRAFQMADEAADGAQRAASRASTRNEERLEKVMHAAHAHWLDAERHHGGAREAHADGQKSRLEYHATEVINAAVETQRAAGVATTADALKEVLEGLKPATERARQDEARAQLQAELDKQKAEEDRELTAVTRMDAANRERLQQVRWRAESAVPELGWWPTLAADMAHAYQGRLWLDETGTPRLLKTTADGGVVAGRKVNAERVAMLRAARFLVTGTDRETLTLLHPSDMGREALYLATLYPEGLQADERAAYDARYARARRPWMNNEERKSAARRLPPLDPHAMRAVREKPVLLEDDQFPQISTEKAARHADMAELAQRLWRWTAMSHGETSNVIQAPGTAPAQEPEALPAELGQDDARGGERATAAPPSELPPTPGQNATPGAPASPPAADVTSTQPRNPELGDETVEPQGWPGDAHSALAEASSVASRGDDEVPTALPESPRSQDDSAPVAAADSQVTESPSETSPASSPPPAPAETDAKTLAPATDLETRWRERLAQNAAAGEVLGIDPNAGESFEGYAGRFDGDYDITLPSGRYCYRTPGIAREKYSVRHIPDPTRAWESKQIGTVSSERDIMPMVRRHAARHADQRDPLAVELNRHEQKALDAVARGVISRSLGAWYLHDQQGTATEQTDDWTTLALWTLSALGLIHVPPVGPARPQDRFAWLSELGERRHTALRGGQAADIRQPGVHEQTSLFAEPVADATSEPDAQADAAVESASETGDPEAELPRFSQERRQVLAQIARGTISVVNGVFMQTNPRRPIRQAPSQSHFRTVMQEGLAREADGQVHLSERGLNWCTLHNITLPSVPPDTDTVDQAPLPPIDYAPLYGLSVPETSVGAPLPPAPAPLPAAWHRRGGPISEESEAATYTMAAEASERAARSTARDVAVLAAGADHKHWTHQHPLAQYDENAAAALETLSDPVTHGYATRAVLNLRAALEEAGKEATDHYVQNVRSPQWKTNQGVQADDLHRSRVRGIVITYLDAVRDHAEEHGLDAATIVHVLEDAAGWTGELRRLGNTGVGYPQLPAAESVAEAAQYVANALRAYALGETDTVDTWADRRETWRTVGPRPAPVPAREAALARPEGDLDSVEAEANTVPATMPVFPRLAQARRRALVDIARGNITEVDGVFMKRTPQHTVERAYSQHAVTDVLALGLAERAGQQIHVTEQGTAWLAHHNIKLTDGGRQNPAAPGNTVSPPIGSHAPATLPATGGAEGSSQPPAPAPSEPPSTEAPAQGDAGTPADGEHQPRPAADESPAAVTPTTDAAAVGSAAAARTAADDGTRSKATDRHEIAQDQAMQAQPSTGEVTLAQPKEPRPSQGLPEDVTAATPIASGQHVEARAAQDPDGPTSGPATSTPRTPAASEVTTDVIAQDDVTDVHVPLSETTSAPADQNARPVTELDAPVPEVTASTRSGDGPVPAPPGPKAPPRPPAAVHEERTMATSAPPGAAAVQEPASPDETTARETPMDPESPAPYPDPAAYTAAHQALLTELDQHEQWLALTPAAAEAATTLADTVDLGIPGLAALLALQAALGQGPDEDSQRTHLAQRLGHHIQCGQMTMAKIFFARAARANSTDLLRDLYERAVEGQFLAFDQQTEDGRMELGQYIPLRARQITRQSHGAKDPAEPAPQTAQEATPMAVDLDDDIEMPVLELSGEVPHLTSEEAAPRLLALAQTHLAGGRPSVEQFAHIYGRPVYAMVPPGETPTLYLALTPPDADGDTRAVSIRRDELATVTAETLLTAMTGWLNGSDTGERPLLDYASATAPTPTPDPAEQEAPIPTHSPAPAAATAEPTMANDTAAKPSAPQAPAPDEPAEAPEAEATSASTPPAPEPAPAPPSEPELQPTAPARTAATSTPAASTLNTAADGQARAEDTGQETVTAPAADPDAAAQADPVAQITALVRTALSDGGVTLDAAGTLTAPGTVTITLETSGNPERDRGLAETLRTTLNNALRQHPEQQLAAYRVDFEHTSQLGQGSLSEPAGTTVIPVPRDRLIAVNNAAAKIFAEQLRSDPNAELARTYLSQERKLPSEVQQEWGLGYAPSDRGAKPKRWDVMVRALQAQGYTEDELLHAGLATRSRPGALIDAFDDRIMFPIHDAHGDIVGFSGRRIDRPGENEEQAKERQSQKYYNTSNEAALFSKGELLFGLYHPAQAEALAGSSGPRVSVEGYLDVIAVARAAATLPLDRRPVVGAPMGADISKRQLAELRGLDHGDPRPHIMFLDADDSGHKVLLSKSNELLRAPAPTEVTTAPDAKDAAKLWEEDVEAGGDGAASVLAALEQRRPLLDAIVEAALLKHADERERANHAFDSVRDLPRTRFIAAEAARYIHQAVQVQAPGDTAALEQAALTWAKRLDQEWGIRGWMTATAVLLGPGEHREDYENEVYEQALDLLAADPEGYFANDSHVRSRQSASEARTTTAAGAEPAAARRPGQWPAGTGANKPVPPTSTPANGPDPGSGELVLSMFLPSPVDPVDGPPVEYTDRTTAAYALHMAVHERLVQHTTESPESDRLPQPLKLGTVHGIDLSTSGDDQNSEDPTVVVWLGPSRNDSLRLSYSRFIEMTGPQLLAAVEWRAAQAKGLLGTPLSQTWRNAVRSIIPPEFPAHPTPAQLADLLDTIAQGPDAGDERIRHRAEQAVALYTADHADLALNHLSGTDHIWVLRNDGSWIQEEAPGTEQTWEELDNGFSQEAAELRGLTQEAAALPPGEPVPPAADLTVAHHSAHEALAALRPYSIGLPGTLYEKITDLVAQMDASEPALRRLRGPGGEKLMNRTNTAFVRVLEGLATVASKIRLTALSTRLERTVARLRGQDPAALPAPRAVRADRRMQDLAHIERDLERRMAAPTTTLAERGELQEEWIINRARWRARYEQLHGLPPESDFLPDNDLIAGAPPVPNLVVAHDLLIDRLTTRVAELRDTDPHTGEDGNPYDPTADLFNGVAWAYHQRLIGTVPTGADPHGPIPATQLRRAALLVTSHRDASPLTLRRSMNITAERADRLLHRLEEQQILGPYRADAPRTVLARPSDIDTLLARPATPPALRKPAAEPAPATTAPGPEAEAADPGELDEARIHKLVSKLLADQQKRSETHGEPDPADSPAPTSRVRKNQRTSAHKEAEANALAAGQPTPFAPSQT
ncbi:hypothetical protein [Streptomyces sp. NPDC002553]|uniref:hypothetical protein n=1 Tax=Streptomyces sp. NPDC002553 TaxID=3154417 RepID=UPI003319C167